MNESHPWRDGSQTILFVLVMPIVFAVALCLEHLTAWLTYGQADARERGRRQLHVVAAGAAAILVAGIGTGSLVLVVGLAAATAALMLLLEVGRGLLLFGRRLGGRAR